MTDYRAIAAQDARRYGIPVAVFLRQINQESGFNPRAHSSAGADGIAQFIPSTAREYGVNTHDPLSSLLGAARYDARLLHQYGSIARALSAYNSGRPDAYKDPGFAGGQTYNYVRSILGSSPASIGGGATPAVAAPAPARVPAAAAPDTTPLRVAALQQLIGQVGAKTPDYTGFLGAAKSLRQAETAPAPAATMTPAPATSPAAASAPSAAGTVLPVKGGKIIGIPYQGTHAKGFNQQGGSDNWESENAYDIAVPVGTPIYAVANGTIGSQFGSLGSGGRFAGLRLHLVAGGSEYYYAHLSRFAAGIRPGARVRAGQVIGYTGSANGVAHLHIAVNHGRPPR